MRAFRRLTIAVPVISMVASFAVAAQAQEPPKGQQQGHPQQGPGRPPAAPGARPATAPRQGGAPQVRGQQGPQGQRFVRGNFPARNFGGHVYHGRVAWEGGRWRHEMHNGRLGWWWDVGGVWYFYPQQMDGPPAYVSDVEVMDDAYADAPGGQDDMGAPPVGAAYPPPSVAYAPPPPPPPPDPAAGAIGGAVVGGLLGGLITGRPVGAAVGAITGGTIGAIAGAQAAAHPGYYLAQGNCYYKYPSGQYVQVDPRSCY